MTRSRIAPNQAAARKALANCHWQFLANSRNRLDERSHAVEETVKENRTRLVPRSRLGIYFAGFVEGSNMVTRFN